MGYTTEFIDRFSLIRSIAREMFVNGYQSYDKYTSLAFSTFDGRKKKIINYLPSHLLLDHAHGSKGKWITNSEARQLANPFYKLFKTKKLLDADISFHFALLSLAEIEPCPHSREELFEYYNERLRYEIGRYSDFWRIDHICINGQPIKEKKPIQELISSIGEENYQNLRRLAISKAKARMGACVNLKPDVQLFVFEKTFKCFIGGREISRYSFEQSWNRQELPISFEKLLRGAHQRAYQRYLGKVAMGDIHTEAILFDADHIITIPDGKIISLNEFRRKCSDEQYDLLCEQIYSHCAKYASFTFSHNLDGKSISFSIKKSLAKVHHVPDSQKQSSSFNISLEKYVQLELLSQQKGSASFLYVFPDIRPFGDNRSSLFSAYPGLKDAVIFFSEESPLGVIGSQIMDACHFENHVFAFRDRYVSQALDSIILYDLFEAINARQVVRIRAEKTAPHISPELIMQPFSIISDMQLGRQYLFGWNLNEQRFTSLRLDIIQSVAAVPDAAWNEDFHTQSRDMLPLMWSNRIWRRQPHSLEVHISYNPLTEKHIPERVRRECRNAIVTELSPSLLRLNIDVYDPMELMPWLLSFTGRIERLSAPHSKLERRFSEHISGLYLRYFQPESAPAPADERRCYSEQDENRQVSKSGKKLTTLSATQSPVFLGIANSYVVCYDHILRDMEDQAYSESDMRRLIEKHVRAHAYRNTSAENKHITLENMLQKRMLLRDEDGQYVSSFGKLAFRPFTRCELRWLYTILHDPKIRLFLQKDEPDSLIKLLEPIASALYDAGTLRYVGVCNDPDPFSSKDYQHVFADLMQAIENKQPRRICYTPQRTSVPVSVDVQPLRLEFSRTRNKFSLYAFNAVNQSFVIIRLSTIQSVSEIRGTNPSPAPALTWDACVRALTTNDEQALDILVSTEANALERFMLEFQVYRKESVFDPEKNQCRVKIWYFKTDTAEMIPKLLRFGRTVEVLGPKDIREAVKDRVALQVQKLVASTEDEEKPLALSPL